MGYDVTIDRTGRTTLVDLKGTREATVAWLRYKAPPFPGRPNSSSEADGRELYWIGDNHCLLRAPAEQEDGLVADLDIDNAPDSISAVLVSDTLEWFSITGPDADQIIAIASPLDITTANFPDDGVIYSAAFGLKALVLRRPNGFELAVERSYGDMVEDYLGRACGR